MLRLKHKKYAFAALFNIQNIMQLLKVKVIRNSMVAHTVVILLIHTVLLIVLTLQM